MKRDCSGFVALVLSLLFSVSASADAEMSVDGRTLPGVSATVPDTGVNDSVQWAWMRGMFDGRASLRYEGPETVAEWHYLYKSGRRYKTGLAVWASPALGIVEGRPMAFVGGYDQTLHALDLLDKKVVWRKIANAEIAHAPVVGKVGGLDVVFWSASDRSVYACVAYSGRRFWTRELVPPSNSLGDSHLSSPLLLDGSLYVSAFVYDRSLPRNRQDGSLYCLDVLTGRIEWRIPVCPGILNSPVGFHVDGRAYVVVAARRGVVRCFDVSEGTPRLVWSFQMPHEVLGSPVVAELPSGPRLFLGSKYGNLIAIDGVTGAEVWQQMAGNWIDNTACVGNVAGKTAVFAGSHDYHLYAFDAETGDRMWRRTLGGEVFSAPCFLSDGAGRGHVAVAALDNHLYIVDADTGAVATSMFTGNPIWDKVAKGETTWGSPVAIEAGDGSVIVYGSYSDIVYVLPAFRACSLTAMARSTASLWWSLLVVLIVFTGVVLPITLGVRSEFGPESGLPISSEVGE